MAPTRESFETKEKNIKLFQDRKSTQSWTKDVGCSQLARRPKKTSKCQERKLKVICLENIKCITKQIKKQIGRNKGHWGTFTIVV